MGSMLPKLMAQAGVVLAVEAYGAKYLLAEKNVIAQAIWGASPVADFLPRAYGGVVLSCVVLSSFTLLALGMKVGKARKECGVELPEMYATGDLAKKPEGNKFNCVQRGHQQALETYPSFLASCLIGGIRFPVSVTIMGLLWSKARFEWAAGYASGDPKKRYDSKWSKLVWTTLIGAFCAAGTVAIEAMGLLGEGGGGPHVLGSYKIGQQPLNFKVVPE